MEADPARAAASCGFGAPKPMRRARQRAASRRGAETHARREPHPMPIPPRAPSDWATVTGDLLKLGWFQQWVCSPSPQPQPHQRHVSSRQPTRPQRSISEPAASAHSHVSATSAFPFQT